MLYVECDLRFYNGKNDKFNGFDPWQVARASAFSVGLVYGSLKLKYLQVC